MMEQVTRDTRKWFAGWANEYDNTLGKVQRHHAMLDLVVSLSGVRDGDQVLDIGCGTGLLSLKFLEKAACSITAIDSSDEMLRSSHR
jgi:ubiquinone/menaquinone biosynthesis C-methylase UbiE